MSAVLTAVRPAQPSIFDMDASTGTITLPAATPAVEAGRDADRQLCRDYLKQWAGSFKADAATAIGFEEFKAASARLAA